MLCCVLSNSNYSLVLCVFQMDKVVQQCLFSCLLMPSYPIDFMLFLSNSNYSLVLCVFQMDKVVQQYLCRVFSEAFDQSNDIAECSQYNII